MDLEQAALTAQLATLQAMWRDVIAEARMKAANPHLSDQARYWDGYAAALERAVQALRGLEDQW